MAIQWVYRFFAELEDCVPKVWRRFEVNGSKTMSDLEYIIMALFEMCALHPFCIMYTCATHDDSVCLPMSVRYEVQFFGIHSEGRGPIRNADRYRLKECIDENSPKFVFEYDCWQINLVLESYGKVEMRAWDLPRVLDGGGYGIIENCGGPSVLRELAFAEGKGRWYRKYRQWFGIDDLDLAAFDIDEMNFRLKKLPKLLMISYEYGNPLPPYLTDSIGHKHKFR